MPALTISRGEDGAKSCWGGSGAGVGGRLGALMRIEKGFRWQEAVEWH